jgi:hypothetical protein
MSLFALNLCENIVQNRFPPRWLYCIRAAKNLLKDVPAPQRVPLAQHFGFTEACKSAILRFVQKIDSSNFSRFCCYESLLWIRSGDLGNEDNEFEEVVELARRCGRSDIEQLAQTIFDGLNDSFAMEEEEEEEAEKQLAVPQEYALVEDRKNDGMSDLSAALARSPPKTPTVKTSKKVVSTRSSSSRWGILIGFVMCIVCYRYRAQIRDFFFRKLFSKKKK